MKAIILCGGFGTRLSSIVSDRPKPLAPIAGKPFLEHVIKWLEGYGYKDITFSLFHRANQIRELVGDGKKYGISPTFIVEPEPQGTGGAIKYVLEQTKIDETILVVNGDTFFNVNLEALSKFSSQKKAVAAIALSHVLDVSTSGDVGVGDDDLVISFTEKPKNSDHKAGLVNGGVYLLTPKAISVLKKIPAPFSFERDYLPLLISKHKVYGYPSDITHFDIGTPAGYRKTEKFLGGGDEIVIRSRAPLRISFGGGGTDVPPFDIWKGGCVLNSTINRYVHGLLRLRQDRKVRIISTDFRRSITYDDVRDLKFDGHLDLIKSIIKQMDINYGFEIQIHSDVPPQSGLGSSAAICAAVIGLFNHLSVEKKLTKSQIAELAYKVETEDLHNQGGRQDQYATVFGGINFLEFLGKDFVKVSPVDLERSTLCELERNTVIAYIGSRGNSGEVHRRSNGSGISREEYLDKMKELGYESYYALLRRDLIRFGTILEETWELKKQAFPGSTSPHIDKLYDVAKKAGAIGGRVTGAGGGGHMVFYTEIGKDHEVSNRLQEMGARVLDFSFDFSGLQTWEL